MFSAGRYAQRADYLFTVHVLPPLQQQKQSLGLPAWSDREMPLRLSALKYMVHREEDALVKHAFVPLYVCIFLNS